MVIPLPESKAIGKPITKLCIIAAQDQRFAPLRCPKSHKISPPPFSCAENKKHIELIIHVRAVYDFHSRSIPFQELRSFLTLTPDTSFHFHSNHTLQHPAASGNTHFHFASFIHSVFPKPFSHAFPMVYFLFLHRVCPINRLEAERKVITPYRCVIQAFRQPKNNAPKTTYSFH
jgi:hypothetical protein